MFFCDTQLNNGDDTTEYIYHIHLLSSSNIKTGSLNSLCVTNLFITIYLLVIYEIPFFRWNEKKKPELLIRLILPRRCMLLLWVFHGNSQLIGILFNYFRIPVSERSFWIKCSFVPLLIPVSLLVIVLTVQLSAKRLQYFVQNEHLDFELRCEISGLNKMNHNRVESIWGNIKIYLHILWNLYTNRR